MKKRTLEFNVFLNTLDMQTTPPSHLFCIFRGGQLPENKGLQQKYILCTLHVRVLPVEVDEWLLDCLRQTDSIDMPIPDIVVPYPMVRVSLTQKHCQ